MCTVTLIPTPTGLRLACNRDEQRNRVLALPPAATRWASPQREGVEVIAPTDPSSGGTWIAANARGLIFVLLNATPTPPPASAPKPKSRGTIIPAIASASSIDDALQKAIALCPQHFDRFRLLLISPSRAVTVSNNAEIIAIDSDLPASAPLMWTSSGLGDSLVELPRRYLWANALLPHPTPESQDAFHAHHWPAKPELSVMMSRPDARTVSTTIIDLTPHTITMRYQPIIDPSEPRPSGSDRTTLTIERAPE